MVWNTTGGCHNQQIYTLLCSAVLGSQVDHCPPKASGAWLLTSKWDMDDAQLGFITQALYVWAEINLFPKCGLPLAGLHGSVEST